MGVVVSWMLSQGLSLAAGYMEKQARDALGSESLGVAMFKKIELIDRKLDLLIQAPLREAIIHLRQGNLITCQEKLIQAIALNDLDLPALVMYCALLEREGQYDLAMEWYETIADRFGWNPAILPPLLIQCLAEYPEKAQPLASIAGFEYIMPILPATTRAFFQSNYFVICISFDSDRVSRFLGHGELIVVLDWTGKVRFQLKEGHLSALAVTNQYIAIRRKKKEPQILALENGTEVCSLSEPKMREMFHGDPALEGIPLGQEPVNFAGASIKFKEYHQRRVETYSPLPFRSYRNLILVPERRILVQGINPIAPQPISEIGAVHIFSRPGTSGGRPHLGIFDKPRERSMQVKVPEPLGGQIILIIPEVEGEIYKFGLWLQSSRNSPFWEEASSKLKRENGLAASKGIRYDVPVFKPPVSSIRFSITFSDREILLLELLPSLQQ